MSDESTKVEAEIVLEYDGKTVSVEPANLSNVLESLMKIDSITCSLKIARSIPRDKFEKNEYFESATLNVQDAYVMVGSQRENPAVRKALSQAILNRARKAFDLCRFMLSEQQKTDGINLVSFTEVTKVQ